MTAQPTAGRTLALQLGFGRELPKEGVSGAALVDYWRGWVGKAELLILSVLIEVWPHALDRESLAAATGCAATGGGFTNAVSRLCTLELISGDRAALLANTALGAAHR